MTAASVVNDADLIPIVQGGTNKSAAKSLFGASLLSASVELTNSQILDLAFTGITIIEAQPNKLINIISVSILLNATAGAYTNRDGTSRIYLSPDGFTQISTATQVSGDADILHATLLPYLEDDTGEIITNMFESAQVINTPTQIWFNGSPAGNLTGGNAANTLKVTVYYVVVDV